VRLSAKGFVVDAAGRLLLLDCADPAVDRSAVGPLVWTQESTFQFRGTRHWTRCHGRVVRTSPEALSPLALTDDEQGSILGQRWWTPEELATSDERFFPRELPALVPQVLAGSRVDQPFDTWD
jgi:hypothetical protein